MIRINRMIIVDRIRGPQGWLKALRIIKLIRLVDPERLSSSRQAGTMTKSFGLRDGFFG